MQFLVTPKMGSSFREPLLYSLATKDAEPQDLLVKIYDSTAGEVVGEKMLYQTSEATIDIAPYIRSLVQPTISLSSSHSITPSPVSKIVSVAANGVMSPQCLVLGESFDLSQPKMLTTRLDVDGAQESQMVVKRGEPILFTLYAPQPVDIQIIAFAPIGSRRYNITFGGEPQPVDVMISARQLPVVASRVEVNIYNSTTLFRRLNFTLSTVQSSGPTLLWRNWLGGIESYTFPREIRLADRVDIDQYATSTELVAKLRNARRRVRLCSAFESPEELERIKGIIAATHVYELKGGELVPIELLTRTIEYGSHGEIRQVVLEIEEEWKGGEL